MTRGAGNPFRFLTLLMRQLLALRCAMGVAAGARNLREEVLTGDIQGIGAANPHIHLARTIVSAGVAVLTLDLQRTDHLKIAMLNI